eukprot:COSAG01_NODE_8888_length_2625_cov_17.199525_1_plen_171_part_00
MQKIEIHFGIHGNGCCRRFVRVHVCTARHKHVHVGVVSLTCRHHIAANCDKNRHDACARRLCQRCCLDLQQQSLARTSQRGRFVPFGQQCSRWWSDRFAGFWKHHLQHCSDLGTFLLLLFQACQQHSFVRFTLSQHSLILGQHGFKGRCCLICCVSGCDSVLLCHRELLL